MASAPTIQAIPTTYKGIAFRSRTEARWAVFFDAAGIAWEYEPEAYKLPSGTYLPDFWLPNEKAFFEVKPSEGEEDRRWAELASVTGHRVHVARGWVGCRDQDSEGCECHVADDYDNFPVYFPNTLYQARVLIEGLESTKGVTFAQKDDEHNVLTVYRVSALSDSERQLIGQLKKEILDLLAGHEWAWESASSADGGGDHPYWWCECPNCGKLGLEFDGRAGRLCDCYPGEDKGYNAHSPRLCRAYREAQTFRFWDKGAEQKHVIPWDQTLRSRVRPLRSVIDEARLVHARIKAQEAATAVVSEDGE